MSDWKDLTIIHGNVEGARAAFERACEMVIRKQHANAHGIRVHIGDGGIDIYVGEFGSSPLVVYQCKYFTDGIGDSQKQQIRKSYKAAISSEEFEVKEWFLCLPIALSTTESKWFQDWSEKCDYPVKLIAHTQLMEWAETSGLATIIFQRKDSMKLDWLIDNFKQRDRDPWVALVEQTEEDCYRILLKLIRLHQNCLKDRYEHLSLLSRRAEAGDRMDACEYVKTVLAGNIEEVHKLWIFSLLSDFTYEPVAYKFIRRYDALIEKAEQYEKLCELSSSEFYSTWNLLRSPALSTLREKAYWTVKFP
jgi:hypothetical protein